MKNHTTAVIIAAVLTGIYNFGCTDSSSTTMQTSQFDGAQGDCTNGGVKIEVLVDGAVDETQTQYICNGANGENGQSGTSTSIKTTKFDDAQGDCTNGGVKIEVLVDGAVDETQTQYICNSATQGGIFCNGILIDSTSNSAHCGGCGNVCPAGTECVNATCTAFSCNTGYHIYNNTCEEDSITNCGTHTNDCTQMPGWNSGQCIEKACVAETCQSGYKEFNNACIENTFVTLWKITDSNTIIQFPVQENTGNLTIDWGDGTMMTEAISPATKHIDHTYSTAGEYTITVRGNIYNWSCSYYYDSCGSTYCAQLAGIQSYGNTWFGQYAFCNATTLTNLPASETPQFKNNDMKGAFYGASQFNQDISYWDTSNVTNMSYMFGDATAFNQPLNDWDTSKVIDMRYMFSYATAFNQPLNNWDTSNVTDMSYMFRYATAFNQPLNNWNVSNVTYTEYMFSHSGLDQTNYCALMSSPYSSYWKQYNLGISYTCP